MIYRFCKVLVRIFIHAVFRVKVYGLENLPTEGGVLLCINHGSLWDVPFSASLLPRRLYFMAKSELFRVPVFGAFLRWAGGFPVRRGQADIHSIKTALDLLKRGEAVTIFPEGKRVFPEDPPAKAKAGAGMIAVKSGCPVVPIGIGGGHYRLFSKKPVYIGRPMHFSNREDSVKEFHVISDTIMDEIRRLAHQGDRHD